MAAVQSVALYGAELWWRGQKNHEYRQAIQALISEAGLVPAQILLDYRQKMYAYRLLTLPDDHHTKKILPISFRNGDADTIRAENQPEDTLTWAGSERPTSLGQWFARQVSVTQAVDPAYGVESIERSWRLNTELPLQAVLQPKREALQEAKKDRDGMVLWADGV